MKIIHFLSSQLGDGNNERSELQRVRFIKAEPKTWTTLFLDRNLQELVQILIMLNCCKNENIISEPQ